MRSRSSSSLHSGVLCPSLPDFQIKWIFMMNIDRDEEIIEGVRVENHSVTLRKGYSLIEKTTVNTSIYIFGAMSLLQKPE